MSKDKVATQSTTYPIPKNYADIYEADNAVDRNITTCMRTDAIGENSRDQTVWWRVDLGGVYNIFSVNVLFKNYYGQGNFFPSIITYNYFDETACIIRHYNL